MAFRVIALLASVLALSSAQTLWVTPKGIPQRLSATAVITVPRRPVTGVTSSSTPVDFSLSSGQAATTYGWLQQPAVYTACSKVASLGTWEAGNVWFQLQGNPTVYWLVLIDQAQGLLPDFKTTLQSIENSVGGSQSATLQFGWVLDPSNRLVVVDFLETVGSCP
jgi:hypothetical protein